LRPGSNPDCFGLVPVSLRFCKAVFTLACVWFFIFTRLRPQARFVACVLRHLRLLVWAEVLQLGTGVDLGMALIGTGPLDFLSHRLQHLDTTRGSLFELIDPSSRGLLMSIQKWFWRLCNSWHEDSGGELAALEWWAGCNLDDDARATLVGLSAAVWARLELKCPEMKP
jgi:hypothetical protein